MLRTFWLLLILLSGQCFAADKQVILTFDDGPDPRYTPTILQILREQNVKATFFVMGSKAKQYPELIRQIYREGHNIANHTYDHFKLTHLSEAKIAEQLQSTNKQITLITKKRATCLRPPYGLTNTRVKNMAKTQGLSVVTWDLNSFDYEQRGYQHEIDWVLKNTKPGFDILLHDAGGGGAQTAKALPGIIKGLRQQGYEFAQICPLQ